MPVSDYDYTAMSTYMTCQRKYKFRIVDGIAPKVPATAPEFGRCIHTALDQWYQSHDIERTVDEFKRMFVENPDDDKRTHKMGEWILRNYDEKYKDQPFKVLSTEQSFKVPLPNGNNLIGRIDKIIEWDGAIWVMDHKTTSMLGRDYMKMHTPNLQFDGYVYAARKLGYEKCCGVLVDAILVASGLLPGPRKNNNLTPLLRDFAYRTDEDMRIYELLACAIQENIANTAYIPNYDACTYYGECPYRRICKEPRDMWDVIIRDDYEIHPWNPAEGAKT